MIKSKLLIIAAAILLVIGLLWRWSLLPQQATLGSLPNQVINLGEVIDIPLIIDTKDKTINAAEVYLTFNQQELEIVEASKDSSLLQLWVDGLPSFSNQEGTVSFAGGLPTPGFQGKGQIGTIKVRGKAKGLIHLVINEKTQVLLNDGQGTALPLSIEPITVRVK